MIVAGSTLVVDVFDEDLTANDGILRCTQPLTADTLHLGAGGADLGCSGSLGTLSMFVTTN